MIVSILFWLMVVNLSCLAMFLLLLLHDRIKYGKIAMTEEELDSLYHESKNKQEKSDLK
jgi:hypothetical protein